MCVCVGGGDLEPQIQPAIDVPPLFFCLPFGGGGDGGLKCNFKSHTMDFSPGFFSSSSFQRVRHRICLFYRASQSTTYTAHRLANVLFGCMLSSLQGTIPSTPQKKTMSAVSCTVLH